MIIPLFVAVVILEGGCAVLIVEDVVLSVMVAFSKMEITQYQDRIGSQSDQFWITLEELVHFRRFFVQ